MKTIRLLVLLLLALAAVAQAAPQHQPTTPPPEAQPQQKAAPSRITPQQAQQLFRSVDEILKWVSQDTGLPIKHPVKRELASREQVEKYILERISEDEDARRLERSQLVLQRFGLLPRQFDLRSFLVSLLKEQVAGFYNAKNKTVYLLDWVEPDEQKPVLAHELTHALQDQNFGLEKFAKSARSGSDAEMNGDERLAARQAAVEGQGMVTLIDYILAPTGTSITQAPQLADAMQYAMTSGPNMEIFNGAPLYIQEVLLFPYRYGLTFERDLLAKGGKEKAFAGVFRNPPQDTRQVMQPATYLAGQSVQPLKLPEFAAATGSAYKKFDVGTIGQFDTMAMVKQYSDARNAEALAPKWRGGVYYAAQPANGDGKAVPAVVYISRWEDADAAAQFAGIYAAALPKRYAGMKSTTPEAQQMLQKKTREVPNAGLKVEIAPSLAVRAVWTSDDGPLYVEPHGDTVLIIEGFDEQAAERLRTAVYPNK